MKRAFSFIELIFTIIIIGILAIIAIPKLNATRDDAQISQIISTTKNIINNSKNYFTSKGEKNWQNATLFNATNFFLYLNSDCSAKSSADTKVLPDGEKGTFYICIKNNPIVKLDFNTTHLTVNLTDNNNLITNELKKNKSFKSIEKSHRLGGISVKK